MKPGYQFTIKDRNVVSPIKDKFVVSSFSGQKTIDLSKFYVNKNDPFKPIDPSSSSSSSEEEPSSSSSEEEDPSSSSSSSSSNTGTEEEDDPKKKKEGGGSNFWIYLLIILIIGLSVGAVILIKSKNDQELIYMKNVGDDQVEYDNQNEESKQDLDTSNLSDDSRL